MNSNLKFSSKVFALAILLFAFASQISASSFVKSTVIVKQEKPKKLSREEKRAIKKAQATAALKNTKRAEKARQSSK